MKKCPQCGRGYNDETLSYCLDDGSELLFGPASANEPRTAILHETAPPQEPATRAQIHMTEQSGVMKSGVTELPSTGRFDKRLLFVPVALLVTLLGGLVGYRYLNPAASDQINSIAVLPLQNSSGSPDSEYLSDGLAESLIYRLSQLPDLKVSSASSVMRYKGQAIDPKRVANELGVQAILSGRLLQRGENLSISVELIDAATNNTLWGEQYERKMSDLLATQREIAATISEKLQIRLSGTEQKGITKRYTDNNEAYQNYLKGRHHWNKRTRDGMERAILHFQKAIDLDPTFALAHVGLASVYNVMPSYGYLAPREASPKAIAAAKRALEIDPQLAEAHSAYGSALTYEFRWQEAGESIKRAVELDPNNAQNHYRLAIEYLAPIGRIDEAIASGKRAIELEPLSIPINANSAGLLLYARKNEAALEAALKTYALEPGHPTANYWLGWAYTANGKYEEAIALCDKVLPMDPENQDLIQIKGYASAKAGRPEETRRMIGKFAEMERSKYVVAARIAVLYAALGEKDAAFRELERGFEARDWDMGRINVDFTLDPLRDDPRFAALVKRLNLPE
jgi:TolB-like protein/Flp pilus assembly protein TadD